MGVSAADVEDDRVGGARLPLPHLDVGDAVVDADEGEIESQGEGLREHKKDRFNGIRYRRDIGLTP